jgi:hypothetical protein
LRIANYSVDRSMIINCRVNVCESTSFCKLRLIVNQRSGDLRAELNKSILKLNSGFLFRIGAMLMPDEETLGPEVQKKVQ